MVPGNEEAPGCSHDRPNETPSGSNGLWPKEPPSPATPFIRRMAAFSFDKLLRLTLPPSADKTFDHHMHYPTSFGHWTDLVASCCPEHRGPGNTPLAQHQSVRPTAFQAQKKGPATRLTHQLYPDILT
ncbi:hypothetical protein E3N88_07121 [Mikania micrantha]|uniref:Uncharacterized protein n=1 Tax=Mikania micrantha TaxID=192012 RepID=A0A5N6PSR1_9ASTR|nr:hypothetical protein E3N88_07121 [Mikania micrantha]